MCVPDSLACKDKVLEVPNLSEDKVPEVPNLSEDKVPDVEPSLLSELALRTMVATVRQYRAFARASLVRLD